MMMLGAAALVIGGASAARAGETVTAKVPFAFVVNGQELPAGDYVVSLDSSNRDLVSIATADRSRAVLVLANSIASDNAAAPKLEFERIGTEMHLSQVTLGPGNAREIRFTSEAEHAPRH
jgi:hypothetical protein